MLLFHLILCFGVLQTTGAVTLPTANTSPGYQTTAVPVAGSTTEGLPLVVRTDKELELFRTNSVELRCNFETAGVSNVLYLVSWYKLNTDGSPGSAFLTSAHGQEVHVEDRQKELGLEGRVSIQPDQRSLNITDVFLHDEGTYRCEVTVLQPIVAKASSDVNLKVVDFQIPGYTENMVVGKGTPVTLTAIVSGSNLPSQNTWRLNGKEPVNNSAIEATLTGLDGRQTVISTFTFQDDVGNPVTVTFKSYIPLTENGTVIDDGTYENSTRTIVVQQIIVFKEPIDFEFCDCRVATFAAAEAGCTIAGTVLVLILFLLHLCCGCNDAGIAGYCIGYPLIVTLFLGVVIGIPVNFFAVQKVTMDAGSAAVIVLSALMPVLHLLVALLIVAKECATKSEDRGQDNMYNRR